MSSSNPSMDDLPPNVMVDILSRLPVKTIIHCKCVCKNWQKIVLDSYFANYHLSRSPKGLMIQHNYEEHMGGYSKPNVLKWVEIEDEQDYHRLQHDPVMCLDLNIAPIFQEAQLLQVGSVNGLICLWEYGPRVDNTYICNPITREYMILPRQQYYREGYATIVYGFGVSLRTNDYKVIRTFEGDIPPDQTSRSRPSLLEAEVYTLGTGQWRSLGHIPYWLCGYFGPFLNGHVHWIVVDKDSPEELCAFDFDSETFKLFPSPPSEAIEESQIHFVSLGVLNGCLSQSDTFDSQFTIWVMKEYGIKKSWHKEVVIKESISPDLDWIMWEPMHLLEGLKDGTILMVYYEDKLLAYDPQSKTIEDTEIFKRYLFGMTYRPGFLRLQNFKLETVHMF
ncbi:F-box associated domain, type 1 [Artemisia annua]|uniref:F-box associated domain, type 1 n=1 Tax=Artemisia annua TaxID=35608 RepID=A0A2U1PYK8_ARTAN|nr:F-box associated domain, type 1 [Artemisia annua]